jgi:hypothetical protein
MVASPGQGNLPIQADAFRALGEWTFDFGALLRGCAIELAKAESAHFGSPPVITMEILRKALTLTCHRTIEASRFHPSGNLDHDGNRSKVA